jgi:hypothetical protein
MAEIITKEQLAQYLPAIPPSRTFQPVQHIQLADRMLTLSCDILNGWTLLSESYTIARDGQQCFAILTFTRGDEGINFSLGWRNSMDKSLAVGLALGAQVTCCSNLVLDGDIKILRKHSMNVWQDIETLAITSFYWYAHGYDKILSDIERIRRKLISDDQTAAIFGKLFYTDILSPRQLTTAVKEWKKPTYTEFEPRSLYSLYNASTHALKSDPPATVMESHSRLHKMIIDI